MSTSPGSPSPPPPRAPAPPSLPPATDGTLKAVPHIVAVITGAITGFLTLHIGLPADYSSYVGIGVATVLTTAVHWIQAKLAE